MLKKILKLVEKNENLVIIFFFAIIVFNIFLWVEINNSTSKKELAIYFIDVGQGDGQLVIFPSGAKILIDGGRDNGLVLFELAEMLPITERYIDLVVMSHSHNDHYGGLIGVLKNYNIGAFISSGHESDLECFAELRRLINEKNIQEINLYAGDSIRQEDNHFLILSPSPEMVELWDENNSSLVMKLNSAGSKTLFTGDIGFKAEDSIIEKYKEEIDILKVAHHGSKYSSSENFLKTIRPLIAVVSAGRNYWGHPTSEALNRIRGVGASIFRTDLNGTVKLIVSDGNINVFPSVGN